MAGEDSSAEEGSADESPRGPRDDGQVGRGKKLAPEGMAGTKRPYDLEEQEDMALEMIMKRRK